MQKQKHEMNVMAMSGVGLLPSISCFPIAMCLYMPVIWKVCRPDISTNSREAYAVAVVPNWVTTLYSLLATPVVGKSNS